jgi:hypothetical protein
MSFVRVAVPVEWPPIKTLRMFAEVTPEHSVKVASSLVNYAIGESISLKRAINFLYSSSAKILI